jgi:hypothetical protein
MSLVRSCFSIECLFVNFKISFCESLEKVKFLRFILGFSIKLRLFLDLTYT